MNRRKFFKKLSISMLLPATLISYFSIKKEKQLHNNRTVILLAEELADQTIKYGILIRKTNNEIHFYQAKCSHLGCQIEQITDGVMICPCHGSKYNLEGDVIKGPAKKKLDRLKFDYLADEKKYIIYKNS